MSSEQDDELELQHKALTVSRIYFQKHLVAPEAQAYLKKRHLDSATARRFELGFSPDTWRGLVDHFSSHRVRLAAHSAGLLTTTQGSQRLLDFFRGRLMFPIRDHEGVLVGYGGRLLKDAQAPEPGKEAVKPPPKYLNTPETDLFKKSSILYGLHEHSSTIRSRREALVVEGYTDVIGLSRSGFPFAVAPMGTALTAEQIALLLDHGVRKLWICFDGDAAGQQAAKRNIDAIMEHYHPGLEIRLVWLPDGHDPDSLIQERGAEAFQACMNESITLQEHVHTLCCEGFLPTPCLEDKALYLVRLEPYVERSGGGLQKLLVAKASEFTGLPEHLITAGKAQRDLNEQISKWHRQVTLIARCLVHDPNPEKMAQRLSRLSATAHGIPELAKLGSQIAAGEAPSGPLYAFAQAHGALQVSEFSELQEGWNAWMKQTQLDSSLHQLKQMPFDEAAKKTIRALLRN
ncbi:DNA primase [Stutzerimonas stutzeri]